MPHHPVELRAKLGTAWDGGRLACAMVLNPTITSNKFSVKAGTVSGLHSVISVQRLANFYANLLLQATQVLCSSVPAVSAACAG